MNIAELSVKNPVTTLMIFLACIVVGAVCLLQLPVDLFPQMDVPAITVMTPYGGASPEDVEAKVTEVLEEALGSVPELKHISSVSVEGLSMITLQFEWATALDTRANDVRDAVGLAKMMLPSDVDEPRVFKFNMSTFPIMVFGITAEESYGDLEKILDDEVVTPLRRLPGIASVAVRMPLHRQVNVDVDRERLAANGLSLDLVALAVARQNKDTPGGNVEMGRTDYLVRVPGEFRDVKGMEDIVLAELNGAAVRLGDVAEVEDGYSEVSRRITINRQHGGILFVQKESDANTVKVARAVNKHLPELAKNLPPDVKIVNLMDSSEDIGRMISDLTSTLLLGGVLTVVVVLLFLAEWRSTFIITLTIPFSLILGIIVDYFLGYTLNMMTLFGLIIAIGMVVDNAIVALENITRHREGGERPQEGAIYGTEEIAMAISASTLTTVCIFFPIIFIKGLIKVFFTPFAVVVIVTLLASLFSALTLTPMLASTMLGREGFAKAQRSRLARAVDWFYTRNIAAPYGRILGWALRHKTAVLVGSVAIFLTSVAIVPLIGTDFMPQEDRGFLQGSVYLPVGTRVDETARVLAEVEEMLYASIPENERIAVYTSCGKSDGRAHGPMNTEESHLGTFGVKLVRKSDRSRNTWQIAEMIREKLGGMAGRLNIEKYMMDTMDPMQSMMTGGEKPLTVNIMGDDMEVTDRIAEQIKAIVEKTPGAVDVNTSREKGRPELWVNVDRAKASTFGLNVADIGDSVRASFYGTTVSKFRRSGEEYDVVVRLRAEDRARAEALLETATRTRSGGLVRARNLANMSFEQGPVELRRKDQGRIVNVTGNIDRRALGDVVKDIEAEISKLQIPPGVEIAMGGQTEEQRESFFWLFVSMGIGMLLVYMVMASQFESLIDPFVVMFSVPFAFTGTVWCVWAAGHHISVVVLIGLLLLIGVVVNNAIVLVDYINILRARGMPLAQAVPEAGKARLRPVLMTALTTIFGLVPMAFQQGQGSEVWNPLGLTVMGGLLVSTFVTLVLVPVIYSLFDRVKMRSMPKETAQ